MNAFPVIGSFSLSMVIAGALCLLLVMGIGPALQAQEEVIEEPSAFDTLMDPTTQGNTVQAAQMLYHQSVRELDRAEKITQKAAETEDAAKREKLLERAATANENAVGQLMQALKQNPEMIEGYEALGLAFRRLGKYQEALEIHAIALRRDPESMDNFRGWSEALLNLNMLGNAVASYSDYAESGSPRAPILMDEIKKWLVAKQADPGDLDPAHVQKMAEWVAQQQAGG